jgi:hypothetical protein
MSGGPAQKNRPLSGGFNVALIVQSNAALVAVASVASVTAMATSATAITAAGHQGRHHHAGDPGDPDDCCLRSPFHGWTLHD